MDDKFLPLDLPLRPETWAHRMPQAFLGLAPSFSAMPLPRTPSGDIWNQGSLAALLGPTPSGGILGRLTQLIRPPSGQTAWNPPTFRTAFLQPVLATTAQLNSGTYQSSAPSGSPEPLSANAGFASAPVESLDRPSTDQSIQRNRWPVRSTASAPGAALWTRRLVLSGTRAARSARGLSDAAARSPVR